MLKGGMIAMNNRLGDRIKNLIWPIVYLSVITGFLSAIIITAFKLATRDAIYLSTSFYQMIRDYPIWLPMLVIGAALIGLVASFILSATHSCRGGGIPTSVAAIRGIVSFKWYAGAFILPISALMTFFCGLPLGTEGPCVQMGTAVGDGVVKCVGAKKHKGWRRYIMTGGASAGFSIATSSPITAIIFSMEELHKHFSPLLLMIASLSVVIAQSTAQVLAMLGLGSVRLFELPVIPAADVKLLFAPVIIGLVCGVCSILFTRFYRIVDKIMRRLLKKISASIVFPVLFGAVALVGFFIADSLGTGHSLAEVLFHREIVWYMMILLFLIRAITMMISNTSGVTGGIFLPTISFGAILGALSAEMMIAFGWIGEDLYMLMVCLGITAFLGATSRIPITAGVFAVEALGGINNILAIIIAVTVSFLVVELASIDDFTDTVIEAKARSITKGKKPVVIEVPLTVGEGSFVIGKELKDILWPNSCVVVSFDYVHKAREEHCIVPGDVITVRYTTYDPIATADDIRILVGEQSEEVENTLRHPAEAI